MQAQLHDALSGNARFVRNLIEKASMRQVCVCVHMCVCARVHMCVRVRVCTDYAYIYTHANKYAPGVCIC